MLLSNQTDPKTKGLAMTDRNETNPKRECLNVNEDAKDERLGN